MITSSDYKKLQDFGYVQVKRLPVDVLKQLLFENQLFAEDYKEVFGNSAIEDYDWFLHIRGGDVRDSKIERRVKEEAQIELNPFKI